MKNSHGLLHVKDQTELFGIQVEFCRKEDIIFRLEKRNAL